MANGEHPAVLRSSTDGGRFSFFGFFGCETVSPIIGDRSIDDRSAIDTFPGIEDQKEIREPLQHHQSFTLRAIHNCFLPGGEDEFAGGFSKEWSSIVIAVLSTT
jgi:hypothetical protein